MGLRREADLAGFFGTRDATGSVLAERAESLSTHPERYAALSPEGIAAVNETAALLTSCGISFQGPAVSPLETVHQLARSCEVDLVWLTADRESEFRIAGGVVCFPSSWSLPEKLGQRLSKVHAVVPDLNATLGRQIETFLTKLAPSDVWRRENWGLSGDDRRNHHPACPRTPLVSGVTLDHVWLRVEHQLLMKLPLSGAILFGIQLEVWPLSTVVAEPEAKRRLIQQLESMSQSAADYKGVAEARPTLIPLLQNRD